MNAFISFLKSVIFCLALSWLAYMGCLGFWAFLTTSGSVSLNPFEHPYLIGTCGAVVVADFVQSSEHP